jgi:hypothetical protein
MPGRSGAVASLLLAVALLTSACGGSGGSSSASGAAAPPAPNYPAQFTAAPAAEADYAFITPLGNMAPPGPHTWPSDHIYFYVVDPDAGPWDLTRTRRLYFPGPGRVTEIRRDFDDSLTIQMNAKVSYYMNHTRLDSSITVGTEVKAGQYLGVFPGSPFAFDLGVIDLDVTIPLVRPEKFPSTTPHAGKPLAMFTEPLRTALYARVRREGPDKDGRIDYEVPGTASGYWFLQGITPVNYIWTFPADAMLALARAVQRPDWQAVSIGGNLAFSGIVCSVGAGQPDFTAVTPASGEVTYTLHSLADGPATGAWALMRLQLLGPDMLKIETWPLTYPSPSLVVPPFSGNARVYVR